jgi:hypothetical protein
MRVRVPGLALLAALATMLSGAVSAADASAAFDKDAAVKALAGVDLSSCKATQPGEGHVLVTFQPRGKASEAVVDRGEFGSAKVAKCIAGKFRKVTVPPFDGPPVRVSKTFHVE